MKRLIVIIAMVLIGGWFFTHQVFACGGWFEASCDSATNQQQNEQYDVTQVVNRLINNVPAPQLNDSLERKNISKRLTIFSDPNKVSYIYLISYGKVMAFYTVKGKVTSGQKRLTSTQRLVSCTGGNGYTDDCVMESPELDGTYGQSGSYIFFWDTDGVYHQWSGDYLLVDQPQQLVTPPDIIQQVK